MKKVVINLKDFEMFGENERHTVAVWHMLQRGETLAQKEFLSIVGRALEVVERDFAIPKLEENKSPLWNMRGMSSFEWAGTARDLAPEYGSAAGTLYELYLVYAYHIAIGEWDLSSVCDKSAPQDFWKAVFHNEGGYALCGGNFSNSKPIASVLRYSNPYEEIVYATWVLVLRKIPFVVK